MANSIHTRENKVLVKLIRNQRLAASVTQIEMAKQLKTSQSTYSKLERAELRIDIHQLRKICKVNGTTLPKFVEEFEKALKRPMGKKPKKSSR